MINKLAHLTFLRVAGLAAGAAAVSGAVVLVSASAAGYTLPFLASSTSPSQTTGASLDQQAGQPSALCTDFLNHLSGDLNTSQAALNAAYQKAIGETLADEVKSGKLTQARADAIKKRLAGKAPCAIANSLLPRPGLAAFRPALLSAAASALGISNATLKADLREGMTLSQIAAAQHVTEAQFRDRLIARLKPVLDAAVTNKKLTPAREQAIIKRLQTGAIPLWDKPVHKPSATPTTTTPSA
ncbi:MAG TPA: hypothetical protein VIO80_05770 [Candidatus Dormibacteraeota bacterium]